MQITEVSRSNRRDVRAFINLPFDIYRDIPQWVPPLMPGERARFKPDYAFYKHSEAAYFLVCNDTGHAVGRLAVLEHRPHNAYRNKKDALLYLYEAIDDDTVASLLFGAAEQWARSRGLTRLVGPKGFVTGDGLGLLVEGFEHRPAIGIPYNPPYYPRQWVEIGGMQKELDYLSAYMDRDSFNYPERVMRIAQKIRERGNFHVPRFKTKTEIRACIKPFQKAYNRAFADVWAYTPIPDEDIELIVNRILMIADPSLIKLIFKDNDLAGFTFAYPDVSAAFQRIKGRLWPFGWIAILLEQRRTEWININGNAILPEYRGLGGNAVLYDELIRTLRDSRYQKADFVQVQETNLNMLSDLAEIIPMEFYKRHRVYTKQLE